MLRCGCPNEGDETVFGPRHDCSVTDRLAVGNVVPPTCDCGLPFTPWSDFHQLGCRLWVAR